MGAVFSLRRAAAAVSSFFAQVQRHILLGHCCGTICPRKAPRILRPRDFFCRLDPERAYVETLCCGRRMLRNSDIFQKAAADLRVLNSVYPRPVSMLGSV